MNSIHRLAGGVVAMAMVAVSVRAQRQDYGAAYSFAERAPVSAVERTIDALLPSLVKIHGASGLKTISAFATGILVSKEGHILCLDQIMLQPDRTRVVLYENGLGYFKHMMGPILPLAILIFPLELLTMFVIRPVTLAMRLMLNIAVDHLLTSILVGIFCLFLPIPIMVLGTLVALVQPLVFCLLSSIYITLATEHEDHGDGHEAHGHDDHHGKKEVGAKKAHA